ncbi:adenosylhomocysteinase [Candidatus Micrarchaeota archaeon CG10_big_fil_rev_8_21_14_0_10_54_18]|nr:MAG: adenosylhomocysteinase [Candidatus Micrarchaeota archaeon CG09_land_8_20_14_0_10_55_25]PJD01004.1 MAG: adenosylhomocysteinase [Candidatus Micrarchaeota archaeon CG10_big_fil_rev_8_21_14_0_10_54_18]
MDYEIGDESLSGDGAKAVEWARNQMPVLALIRKRFQKEKPLKGARIAACLHVTKETAVLMETLVAGGAKVALCASNPLSTQDNVAAALVSQGIPVFAVHGIDEKGYYRCINKALDLKPTITVDDGADLVNTAHTKRTELLDGITAGQEETTTGVIRLRAMASNGALKYPIIAVNDTPTKHHFDNFFGTGQSTMDGIIRATDVLIAGKTFVIAGFGYCGHGLALRARGLGAKVVVTEVNPVKALEAHMHGFQVMPMDAAAGIGDIFVTATGDKHVIRREHFEKMRDGAIVANTGHFNVELDVPALEALAEKHREIRPEVEEYKLKNGRRIYLLAHGRLVNLACASGHPSSVMDMSFADQALVAEYLHKNASKLENKVYDVPKEIDDEVARLKLKAEGLEIDSLTPAQQKYLSDWRQGT